MCVFTEGTALHCGDHLYKFLSHASNSVAKYVTEFAFNLCLLEPT